MGNRREFSSEGCADAMCAAALSDEIENHADNGFIAQQRERIDWLENALAETQMRAFKWMDAHDKRAAGKPYDYPSPVDAPNSIARVADLTEALTRTTAVLRDYIHAAGEMDDADRETLALADAVLGRK